MDDFGDVLATQDHKRFFFVMCKKCDIDPEVGKARVKEKYKLDSFANVTTQQLHEVINALKDRYAQGFIENLMELVKGGQAKPKDAAITIIKNFKMEERSYHV